MSSSFSPYSSLRMGEFGGSGVDGLVAGTFRDPSSSLDGRLRLRRMFPSFFLSLNVWWGEYADG